MRPQVRSEWVKLLTVRSTWVVLGLVTAVEVVLRVVGVLVAPPDAGVAESLGALRPSIVFATSLALLPALVATTEWRHGTAVTTYALQPVRGRVLAAKLLVAGGAGAAVGLGLGLLASAAGLVALAARSMPVPPTADLALLVASGLVTGPAVGVVAAALGHLLRDQAATVTALVVVLFVLPLPVALLSPAAYAWSPSGLVDGAAGLATTDPLLLGPYAATACLVVLASTLALLADADLRRRDLV